MRVIVVDDMLLVRDGLVRSLRDRGIDVVADAPNADNLLHLVDQAKPDVVILDIRMPPTFTDEGLAAAAMLRAQHEQVGILVLSQYLESAYAVRLLNEAPQRSGYLLKDRIMHMATLIDALERITLGETVIDPTIVTRVMGRRRKGIGLTELSNRELEVMSLVAEGLSNRAIADRITVNERTVETHIAQIFLKLGLELSSDTHRRVLAVITFLRSGESP